MLAGLMALNAFAIDAMLPALPAIGTDLGVADDNRRQFRALWLFIVMQGLAMAAFAFTSANLSTLAMEHMAPIAGTASSVQGVIGTIGGAGIGLVIGQAFDGTQLPFLVGTAACGAIALVLTLITERGRLMRDPRQPAPVMEDAMRFPD